MKGLEDFAETATLTELVRLQDLLSRVIVRRFQRPAAVVFTDVVGSTPYFARFGNEPGRKLQQRHFDLLAARVPAREGRVVDTAGDGALLVFPTAAAAVGAAIDLLTAAAQDNDAVADEHRLALRIGVHWGPVLTDGDVVSGDVVNVTSRITSAAAPQEIRLSQAAWTALTDARLRLRCRRTPTVELKGIGPTDLFALEWRDPERFPSHVRFADGASVPLPGKDLVRLGRLPPGDGEVGNDVLLLPVDPQQQKRIGRYHLELRRRADGCFLRAVSQSPTEVDGALLPAGEEVRVGPGAKIRVGGVLGLELGGPEGSLDATLYTHHG